MEISFFIKLGLGLCIGLCIEIYITCLLIRYFCRIFAAEFTENFWQTKIYVETHDAENIKNDIKRQALEDKEYQKWIIINYGSWLRSKYDEEKSQK